MRIVSISNFCAVVFTLLLHCNGLAMAQQQDGTTIGGDININADVSDATSGASATAITSIGTISGSVNVISNGNIVGGDVQIDVIATRNLKNIAQGSAACAKTSIGSVGTIGCTDMTTIHLGASTNVGPSESTSRSDSGVGNEYIVIDPEQCSNIISNFDAIRKEIPPDLAKLYKQCKQIYDSDAGSNEN